MEHDLIRALLLHAGDNPDREGLRDTPARVLRAYGEWFSGYALDPASLFKTFEDGAAGCDEMVMVANLPVYSFCEHHIAPFWGLAHVAYIPDGKILGLSKFSRLVEIYARRLQVQERLTNQIAECLADNLKPRGLGVVLECRHTCMESRGVRVRGCITVTSSLRGALKADASTRSEFFSLVRSVSAGRSGI